jgi:hypothetical protein
MLNLRDLEAHWFGLVVSAEGHVVQFPPETLRLPSEETEQDCNSGDEIKAEAKREKLEPKAVKTKSVEEKDPPSGPVGETNFAGRRPPDSAESATSVEPAPGESVESGDSDGGTSGERNGTDHLSEDESPDWCWAVPGDNVGAAAAQSLSEPLAQGVLNAVHHRGEEELDLVKRVGVSMLNIEDHQKPHAAQLLKVNRFVKITAAPIEADLQDVRLIGTASTKNSRRP